MIFRGSIPHPMQSLCTLRSHCRQGPRNTRYQADATPYLGRTCTGWIAPACGWRTYSITSSARASSDRRHREAERLGGLEVDDQLVLGRRLDRQIGGLLALEDAVNVAHGGAPLINLVRPVRNEAAFHRKVSVWVDSWQFAASCERYRAFYVAPVLDIDHAHGDAKPGSCSLRRAQERRMRRRITAEERAGPLHAWRNLFQYAEPFAAHRIMR